MKYWVWVVAQVLLIFMLLAAVERVHGPSLDVVRDVYQTQDQMDHAMTATLRRLQESR